MCCGSKQEIVLYHRENTAEEWGATLGNNMDDAILRWMNCIVTKVTWERGKPLLIAVEGVPYAWGV